MMALDYDQALSIAREVLNKEAEAINRIRETIGQEFWQAIQLILACRGKVVIMGVGKSGHIGRKIAASLASLGTPSFFVHADEAAHGDLGMLSQDDILILISHSGETAELLRLLPYIGRIGCKIISITGSRECSLARRAVVALTTGVVQEADPLGLAPTSSSTATLALGDALAVTLAQLRGFSKEEFALLHPGGTLGEQLCQGEVYQDGPKEG